MWVHEQISEPMTVLHLGHLAKTNNRKARKVYHRFVQKMQKYKEQYHGKSLVI